jgi:hypothetical protein
MWLYVVHTAEGSLRSLISHAVPEVQSRPYVILRSLETKNLFCCFAMLQKSRSFAFAQDDSLGPQLTLILCLLGSS